MTMTWFTADRLWGKDDTDIGPAYWDHLESIREDLTPGCVDLAFTVNLHDARIDSYRIGDDGSFTLSMITGSIQESYWHVDLRYTAAVIVEPRNGNLNDLELLCGDVELLYDEVDVSDGRYVHRIIVWPSGYLVVEFNDVDVHRELSSAAEYESLFERNNRVGPPCLEDAWLDFTSPLFRAAALGDAVEVERLLKEDPVSLNESDEPGWTVLHVAALRSHLDVCRALVAAGADVNARDDSGHTPLFNALAHSDTSILTFLHQAGADPLGGVDDAGASALGVAVMWSNLAAVTFLIDHGADIDATEYGHTALHTAAETSEDPDFIQALLALGANPLRETMANDFDPNGGGLTAAELARRFGYDTTAEILERAASVAASTLRPEHDDSDIRSEGR